jgi:hypothetical protein
MSSIELVADYLAERARPAVFVPLALLIAASAWLAAPGTEQSVANFVVCAMQALLFVFAFRIWDDLEDRACDAVRHPDRVIVRAGRTSPVAGVAVALAVGGALPLLGGTVPLARIAILLALVIGLLIWYRARPSEASRMSGVVVLTKYPAIALALAPGLGEITPARATTVTGVLYLIACTYEYLDDRSPSRGIS